MKANLCPKSLLAGAVRRLFSRRGVCQCVGVRHRHVDEPDRPCPHANDFEHETHRAEYQLWPVMDHQLTVQRYSAKHIGNEGGDGTQIDLHIPVNDEKPAVV